MHQGHEEQASPAEWRWPVRKRYHHTHPRATERQIIAHPMLDWQRSDCDCEDDDRDWILDAETGFDRADKESPFVFLVMRRSGQVYWEYGEQRHFHDSLLAAIIDAERWVRRCVVDSKRQGLLRFDGSTVVKGGVA